jgi:hypothetical protein
MTEEFLTMSTEDKLAFIATQDTEPKLCSILEPDCDSCQ